ncbi:hypothetical protein CGZ69_13595 [Streptomyces peucetius subsp. caesius ATCC 27952]|nr:hypothetical protein CGZ69_13595 [Streptomyces peucetius subsp. caesius ATCC 27952]
MDGVSTYLALIFGTLLSSQGTDASFVLTLAGFPPGASLRSCVSNLTRFVFRSVSGSESISGGRLEGLFAFRLPRLYQKHFGRPNRLGDPEELGNGLRGNRSLRKPDRL